MGVGGLNFTVYAARHAARYPPRLGSSLDGCHQQAQRPIAFGT
jgi:hypothetical protein